ncbi:SRPBCC family protein [Psychromicrobium xiongbiense]|uniref:SRPBCC family protein n=1 Tax=Psychromicrobium xiongbiense TaxID=3051184 RepID=UPI0025574AD1|nr:SRPBCC family protein [Psychromicrobium sp. YIM S02556]
MISATHTVTIDRTPAEVYALLTDGLNNPRCRAGVTSIELVTGAAGSLGARYGQTMSGPGGRPIQGDDEITAAEPGRRLAFQVVAGPARPQGTYRLAASGSGTRADPR